MPRSRRADDEAPVTFFAFQDVMMCTIGITLITTVLLVLQLGQKVTLAAPDATGSSHDGGDAERRGNATVLALTQTVRDLEARRNTDADRQLVRDVVALKSTSEQLDQARVEVGEAREKLQERLRLARADQQALLALELMTRRDALLEQLEEVSQRRRVAYLVAPSDAVTPLVLEVSQARLVMSTDRTGEPAMSLDVQDADSAARAIVELILSQPNLERHYLLVVLKPSGIPMYWKLSTLLGADPRTQHLRIGLDLIPEDYWTADEFPARPNDD